ncbi:MAG: DUF4920 domain-containing protein [bacterium]
MIKKISFSALVVLILSSVSYSQHDENIKLLEKDAKMSDEPVGIKMTDGILYGKDYDGGMTIIEFSDLMKNSSDNNDKVVIVKGNVSEVCQEMGCWMIMSEGSNTVRIKTMHEFFLPKDIAGRKAVVIGKFKVTEITEEMARHYNEESKNPAIKTENIKGPQKVYEMEAMGIKILNSEANKN